MKQVVQHLRSGRLELLEVPCPAPAAGHVLVQTTASVISPGTERMLVEFARGNLLAKARQQPERVRQVWEKIKTDGVLATLQAVRNRLDEPLPLGYSSAGRVIGVGPGVTGFAVGDRVATNGPHAEIAQVPMNLAAVIPQQLADEKAAFAVLSAISLQGIRLLAPAIGEHIAVYGLGLLGLLAVQMLSANGCNVLGIDLDEERLELARRFGATAANAAEPADVQAAAQRISGGHGVDGVLITASSRGDEIIHHAAQMTRRRGRLVLVGVVDMELRRADFYEKELSFQVSCSYGPGRYDKDYERGDNEYPYGHVRWTEQRNIAAALDLMTQGRLDPSPLITQRVPHSEAERAYDLLTEDPSQLALVLTYPEARIELNRSIAATPSRKAKPTAGKTAVVGVIGAGQFTKGTLLPALQQAGANVKAIASRGGLNAAHLARKYAISQATTDYRTLFDDDEINTVIIATRHDSHAELAAAALAAGKHVLVEKPLAIDEEGLCLVRNAFEQTSGQQLAVGFNRRFSPLAVKLRELLASRAQPASLTVTVNAGALPPEHWLNDAATGGGRIVGEGCHWIDLMFFLLGRPAVSVHATPAGDSATVTLTFRDGSIGTLHYFTSGHRSFPKERIEAFSHGRVLVLDNFRRLIGHGWAGFRSMKLWRQDKGHRQEIEQFLQRVAAGGEPLIPLQELWDVAAATLAAAKSLREGRTVSLVEDSTA